MQKRAIYKFSGSQVILARAEVEIVEKFLSDIQEKLREAFDYIEGDSTDKEMFPTGEFDPEKLIGFITDIDSLTDEVEQYLTD